MAKYNGHKNWNHWNVSLWPNNDEILYGYMLHMVKQCKTRDIAARAMLELLEIYGIKETPDGAPYSLSSIRAAMRDIT